MSIICNAFTFYIGTSMPASFLAEGAQKHAKAEEERSNKEERKFKKKRKKKIKEKNLEG